MQLLLLICFVIAASGLNAYAQVAEETDILKLTQKINDYVTECIAEENIEMSTDDATAIVSEEPDKDVEKVTLCFFHKAGILEPDGKLNSDAAMAILTLIGVEKNAAEDLLRECTSITGFDAKDMAYAIFKCFDNGARA